MAASRETTSDVTIYTTAWCPYCHRAKDLLQRKGVAYAEIDVGSEPDARAIMIEKAGRTSVPQIFVGDEHIGGSDELSALERGGELDRLLGRDAS